MKKIKFSIVEKQAMRTAIILVLIQVVIVIMFVFVFRASQPIDIKEINQIDIIVEDIYLVRSSRSNKLLVVSDSTMYLFQTSPMFEEYSVNELYELISKGSKLSIRYFETYMLYYGKVRYVVDARSETETYRSIEAYYSSHEGAAIFVIILFSVLELFFIGLVFITVLGNSGTFKGIYKKIKKHKLRSKQKQ